MPRRRVISPALAQRFAALRAELDVPAEFPPGVLAEAERAATEPPPDGVDRLDLDFVTIDPPGSRDLDQAVHIERRPGGYRVHYAIADVAARVAPGGAVDAEAFRRGATLYAPDGTAPLHPRAISENAASLLPGAERSALLWTVDLDADGARAGIDLVRARVRSRKRLDYAEVQAALDGGTAPESLCLLAEVGSLLQARERARGAVRLRLPDQEVDGSGHLAYRAQLPVEDHNAQISLLTGRAAAALMLEGGIGLLRTVPPASAEALAALRRVAVALGVPWPDGAAYPEFIWGLDPGDPRHAAVLYEATAVLRGAGYAAFDGPPPEQPEHAAIAAPYAHVTAPLRRLADRHALATCLALVAGAEVPDWVRAALPELPEAMAAAARRAGALERAVVDLVEAVMLQGRVGEVFAAVVVDEGRVQLREPAVIAPCDGDPPIGEAIDVRLVEADPERRAVRFEPV